MPQVIHAGTQVRLRAEFRADNTFFRMSREEASPPFERDDTNRKGDYYAIPRGATGTVVAVFPRPITTSAQDEVLHIAIGDFIWEISSQYVREVLPSLDDLEEVERWLTN